MSISNKSTLRVVGQESDKPRRSRSFRPALVIVALCAATIVYMQGIGVVDKGTSNVVSYIAFGIGLVALALWIAFFAPLTKSQRRWWLGIPATIFVLLVAVVRIDGFDGNVAPQFAWRWTPKHDAALTLQVTNPDSQQALDVSPTENDYPGFLGRNRDAFVPDIRLDTDWESHPPRQVWRQPIGAGYSAFAICGKAGITLEQRGPQELVTGYDLHTGKLVWSHAIEARHHDPIGGDGPSSTPTIHEGRVFALGGTGVLRCLDAATGSEIWIRDVLADVGTTYEKDRKNVSWGRSASPLVVGDLVIVPAGGPGKDKFVSLIAYNKHSGDIVWKGGKEQVSYSSPLLAHFGGERQIVIVNEDSISGHKIETGEVLWIAPWAGSSYAAASASQVVPISDDRFFVSKGYSSGGAALFQITPEDSGKWKAKKLWHRHRVLKTKQNNVVVKDQHVYGMSDGTLQCVDLATGRVIWEGDDFGHGQIMRIGDVLLITQEWGAVALVAADPNEYRRLAQFQAIEGKTWNNPALAGRLLLVRNAQEAACFELPMLAE